MKLLGSLSGPRTVPYAVAGFLLFFAISGATYAGFYRATTTQPIVFNHAKHVGNGIGCVDCHAGVEAQPKATLPGIDVCMGCHQVALTSSPEEERIRTVAAAGEELKWVALTQVAPHVFFSHRRHVSVARLSCAECHGAVEQSTKPPKHAFRVFKMDTCLNCHQQHRVNADCNDCHR